MMNKNKEDLKKIRPWILLVTYTILFAAFVFRFDVVTSVFSSFIGMFQSILYAIGFAFVINVVMVRVEKLLKHVIKEGSFLHRFKRGIAITLSLIIVFGILILMFSIIVPRILESFVQLLNNLSGLLSGIVENIDKMLTTLNIDYQLTDIGQIRELLNMGSMDWAKISSQVLGFLSNSAGGIWDNAMSFTARFAIIFTGFMFSLYLLSGKESFIRQTRKVVVAACGANRSKTIFYWGTRANQIFTGFITGQLVEAGILWVLYFVTMKLFHFPYPELISTLIAVCSLVPVFGSMFAMSVGAILILSENFSTAVLFVIYYQLMQQFEDNVIYPRVVGNSVGLPGLWVLLSIFVFGAQFGIIGMLLAVPTTAFFYAMFTHYINEILKKRKISITDTEMITADEQDNVYSFKQHKENDSQTTEKPKE